MSLQFIETKQTIYILKSVRWFQILQMYRIYKWEKPMSWEFFETKQKICDYTIEKYKINMGYSNEYFMVIVIEIYRYRL